MRPLLTARTNALIWAVLGTFSGLYLASLYFFPVSDSVVLKVDGMPAAQGPRGNADSPLAGITERLLPAPAPNSIKPLQEQISSLEKSVADLRKSNAELKARFEKLEQALGPPTAALPPEDSRPKATVDLGEQSTGSLGPPQVTLNFMPLPDSGFGDGYLDNTSPLPVAGPQTPTRTQFAVELARAKSAAALKGEWEALSKRHSRLLARLEPRQRKNGEEGGSANPVSLIAGPFSNAADAALLCARLRAAGTGCKETVFGGDAL